MATPRPSRPDDRTSVWGAAAQDYAAWRGGDPRAFDALVRTLTPVLWQVVRAYGLQTATAEDVLQDTWLALARDPGQVRDPAAVGGWLLVTARRRAWRAASAPRELADSDGVRDAEGTAPAAEDAALTVLAQRRLWAAVAGLSERCRRLLRIVAFDDRPDYARIAADLGIPVGSIGPTRRRCLDKLRASLEGDAHA